MEIPFSRRELEIDTGYDTKTAGLSGIFLHESGFAGCVRTGR
jgi:hypothetical protein